MKASVRIDGTKYSVYKMIIRPYEVERKGINRNMIWMIRNTRLK